MTTYEIHIFAKSPDGIPAYVPVERDIAPEALRATVLRICAMLPDERMRVVRCERAPVVGWCGVPAAEWIGRRIMAANERV